MWTLQPALCFWKGMSCVVSELDATKVTKMPLSSSRERGTEQKKCCIALEVRLYLEITAVQICFPHFSKNAQISFVMCH